MSAKKRPFGPDHLLVGLRRFPRPANYWVAFSGGPDSTALLQALSELGDRLGAPLRALHVNHALHDDAPAWQRHCERFCRARGIPLTCVQISVDPDTGKGLEADARRKRYAVALGLLDEGEVLLTAHHAGDQAETVLLNLMRGSGVEGLAGMPDVRPLGKGWLVRPLLAFSGPSLKAYLEDRGIDWIEDLSNQDESYDRNFLRHSLLPVLERRWHGAGDKIAQSANHCREAAGLLADMADELLDESLAHPQVLRLARIPESDPARFKLVIRRWLHGRQSPPLPARRLEELARQCARASPQHHVRLEWDGWTLQLFRRQLWLQRCESIKACPEAPWTSPGPLQLGPVLGRLLIEPEDAGVPPGLAVGPRRSGEKIHFHEAGLSRSVKHLLQEASVPPWLRLSIPLLRLGGEPAALGDWAIGSRLQEWLDGRGAGLSWEPAEPLLALVHAGCRRRAVDPPGPLG
jgi:tRNA(Ile)-lysidine synthase